jgi:exonuclease VII large subunit
VARDETGLVLKSTKSFRPGADFRLTVTDGDVRARVAGEEP